MEECGKEVGMRKYKYSKYRLIYIILWCMIFLSGIMLLMKSIQAYGTGSSGRSGRALGSRLVTAACNYMLRSDFPILNYVADREDDGRNNIILNTLAGVFPINRYVADEGEAAGDQGNEFLLSNGFNLLFNEDTYNQNLHKENSETELSESNIPYADEETEISYIESDSGETMPIDIIDGDVYMEEGSSAGTEDSDIEAKETLGTINGEYFTMKQLLDRQFLYNNFYIIDSATAVSDDLFDAEVLLGEDMTMKAKASKPQILIYHTHSQEAFVDSRPGKAADTVVGVGSHLAELLTDKYGYNVIHDKSKYDMMEGYLERNLAYDHANEGISKILEENPTIEVIIDLHRDGVSEDLPKGAGKRLAKVDGKYAAQVMLFNGLCRRSKGQIITLKNPYIQDNLAFSLQLQLKGREMYPGLMFKNYLHAYRYNQNFRKKSLLVEIGTNRNTVEEAMNAMDYFSDVLNEILQEEETE